MKLAKALKVKNRLAGEIAKLKGLVSAHNTIRSRIIAPGTINEKVFRRERPIDVLKTLEELTLKQKDLCDLKTAITVANIGIYPKIIEMEEAKGMLSYLNTFVGEREAETETDDSVTTVTQWENAISADMKMSATTMLQKRIEELQDEIDEFNATTYIG